LINLFLIELIIVHMYINVVHIVYSKHINTKNKFISYKMLVFLKILNLNLLHFVDKLLNIRQKIKEIY